MKHGIAPQAERRRGRRFAPASNGRGSDTRSCHSSSRIPAPARTAEALQRGREPGVGLRNVERRLECQYGDAASLSIRTAPGEGTIVEIRLPRRVEGCGRAGGRRVAARERAAPSRRRRRRAAGARRFWSRCCARLTTSRSSARRRQGRTRSRLIEKEKPDLALLDWQMPELDGIGVVRMLKKHAMPLIAFVTAYDEYAVRAFEVNAVDYLLKPVEKARLRETLNRAQERIEHAEIVAEQASHVGAADRRLRDAGEAAVSGADSGAAPGGGADRAGASDRLDRRRRRAAATSRRSRRSGIPSPTA